MHLFYVVRLYGKNLTLALTILQSVTDYRFVHHNLHKLQTEIQSSTFYFKYPTMYSDLHDFTGSRSDLFLMWHLILKRKSDKADYFKKQFLKVCLPHSKPLEPVQMPARQFKMYLMSFCLPSLIQTPSGSFHLHPLGSTIEGPPTIYQIHSKNQKGINL